MRSVNVAITVLLLTAPLSAQNISVGSLPMDADLTMVSTAGRTMIDFANPAKASGEVNFASMIWRNNGENCADSFKIKILRPTEESPFSYRVVDDIGPIPAIDGYRGVILSGHAIEVGDVIGVTLLDSRLDCGSVTFARAQRGAAIYHTDEDITGEVDLSTMELSRIGTMALRLTTELYPLDGIIPVVGSVAGAFGSNFRTTIQLSNPDWDHSLDGKLVFLPAAGGAPTEVEYQIAPGATKVYSDFVAEIGATGLGSVDIRPAFSPLPVVAARIFTDQGANGTLGFNEPVRTVEDAMHDAEYGHFVVPPDLTNFRVNVGIRTLDEQATLLITHFSPSGALSSGLIKVYPPNSFQQVPLAAFVNGTPVPNGRVSIRFDGGKAIVYASTTDNRTNDSQLAFVTRGR
jgi:hypothetical protein